MSGHVVSLSAVDRLCAVDGAGLAISPASGDESYCEYDIREL